MSYQIKFAAALRTKMVEENLNQTQVCKLTDIDKSIISRLMTGKRENISYETIAKIANKLSMWLGNTPDELARKVINLEKSVKKYRNFTYFLILIIILELIIILVK